jgi:hypothetical protein
MTNVWGESYVKWEEDDYYDDGNSGNFMDEYQDQPPWADRQFDFFGNGRIYKIFPLHTP